MSRFPTSDSIIGKALPLTNAGGAGVANISDTFDSRSAWLFENQTGTLGTKLNSSVLYVGVGGDVNCILSGVVGVQGTATALDTADPYGANPSYNALSNGSGYFTADGLATTVTSTVPKSPAKQPTGLTVNITAIVPTTNASTPGTNYTAGPYEVTGGTAGASGLSGNITGVDGAGAITGFDITNGGQGYTTGDVLTIIKAGSDDNATITLLTAPNGAITTIVINAAGSNYSPGDIITVIQAGASGGTRAILSVQDLEPTANDAVLFKGIPTGTILPVSVDYVLNTSTTATDIVAGK